MSKTIETMAGVLEENKVAALTLLVKIGFEIFEELKPELSEKYREMVDVGSRLAQSVVDGTITVDELQAAREARQKASDKLQALKHPEVLAQENDEIGK